MIMFVQIFLFREFIKRGECNAEMMAKLAGMSGERGKVGHTKEEKINSQFSGLKELLREKEKDKRNNNK